MYGKKHTEAELRKISDSSKRLWENEEYRMAQSLRMSGENNYFYGKRFFREDNPRYGKHWDDEMKQHFREVNGLKVVCVETGKLFLSCQEAADEIGAHKANLWDVLDKPNRTCKGFHFIRFKE